MKIAEPNIDNLMVEPHPLDYDWRFAESTTVALASRFPASASVLCVGTPSVARLLTKYGREPVLVDRQPIQGVARHLRTDVSFDEPPKCLQFDWAATDPPWYPEIFMRWLSWIGGLVCNGGTILCSLWPVGTRPSADAERNHLLKSISLWCEVEIEKEALHYVAPDFELTVPETVWPVGLHRPRWGDLLRLRRRASPPTVSPLVWRDVWQRYSIGRHQLALRIHDRAATTLQIRQHHLANGWLWPSVSRRAEGRSQIELWSSRNEVAIVEGSTALAEAMPGLLNCKRAERLCRINENEALRPLQDWYFSRLETEGYTEWSHRD